MKNNDQIAIFESYRDEILKNFKDSLSDENGGNIEKDDMENQESNVETDLELDDTEDSDSEKEEKPKRKVVVKSEELTTNVGPKMREILRNIPSVSEDSDILSLIKRSIEKINAKIDNEEDYIKASPLSIYDKLIELNAVSEEEMDNDEFEDFNPEKEPDALQSFEDDDYTEFDDSDSSEQEWKKESEMGKLRDMIRQMGTDWRGEDEDFRSSNY
jgi:hypothetical protein